MSRAGRPPADSEPISVGAIDIDERRYRVSLHTMFDGVEYVGRLWFSDDAWDEDRGFPDRGAIPGRTVAEVLTMATRLGPDDLVRRYHRGLAEKRRYHRLRRVTEEVLAKVRYMNQVAISMRAGLLDADGAAQEIELTERQLHELIGTFRHHAGVETPEAESEW